jgi:hypothetical protein
MPICYSDEFQTSQIQRILFACTSVPCTRIQICQTFTCFSADFVSMPCAKRSTSKISTVLKVDIPTAVNQNKCYYSSQHMVRVSVILTIVQALNIRYLQLNNRIHSYWICEISQKKEERLAQCTLLLNSFIHHTN